MIVIRCSKSASDYLMCKALTSITVPLGFDSNFNDEGEYLGYNITKCLRTTETFAFIAC